MPSPDSVGVGGAASGQSVTFRSFFPDRIWSSKAPLLSPVGAGDCGPPEWESGGGGPSKETGVGAGGGGGGGGGGGAPPAPALLGADGA